MSARSCSSPPARSARVPAVRSAPFPFLRGAVDSSHPARSENACYGFFGFGQALPLVFIHVQNSAHHLDGPFPDIAFLAESLMLETIIVFSAKLLQFGIQFNHFAALHPDESPPFFIIRRLQRLPKMRHAQTGASLIGGQELLVIQPRKNFFPIASAGVFFRLTGRAYGSWLRPARWEWHGSFAPGNFRQAFQKQFDLVLIQQRPLQGMARRHEELGVALAIPLGPDQFPADLRVLPCFPEHGGKISPAGVRFGRTDGAMPCLEIIQKLIIHQVFFLVRLHGRPLVHQVDSRRFPSMLSLPPVIAPALQPAPPPGDPFPPPHFQVLPCGPRPWPAAVRWYGAHPE